MHVLLIEDYQPLAIRVAQGLREEGFAVDAAADGVVGLHLAETGDYDVIVLDLMLPGLDGLSLLKRFQKAGKATRVLILTAKDSVEDRVAGLNAGADDYLVKPFSLEELFARIRALVRRRYGAASPVIEIDNLQIDTVSKSVSRGGKAIELTAREYALMEFLGLRRGQLVSRSEIWEHLYELHSEASSNVVDVYIGYLRRKIERDGMTPLIHTRRGQGYLLGVLA